MSVFDFAFPLMSRSRDRPKSQWNGMMIGTQQQNVSESQKLLIRALSVSLLLGVASGCTVLPTNEVQAIKERGSGAINVDAYVERAWLRARGEIDARALSVAELNTDLSDVQMTQGHRADEEAPWNFFVTGQGVVRRKATDVPMGEIEVQTDAGPIILQTGPVVYGTAVRDVLPYISFNDVADQIAYAEVGARLTERALSPLKPVIKEIEQGSRISFVGAASVREGEEPFRVTPLRIVIVGS